MTHPATEPVPEAGPVPGDALVLTGRPLRPEARLEQTSRFADGIWVLDPAWLRADRKPMTLNFTGLPQPLAVTAKHLCHALLTEDLPAGEPPLSIDSIRTYFSCLHAFLMWVHARGRPLAELNGDDLDAYHHHVVGLRLCPSSTRRYRRAVRMLWAYRTRLPHHLTEDPVRRPVWQALARAHSSHAAENRTDRISEPVLGPLLIWAMRWVEDFSDDVLQARDERDRIDARSPAGPDPLTALDGLLADYRRRGQPLPAAPPRLGTGSKDPVPSTAFLARLLGYPEDRMKKGQARRVIAGAARELGVDTDCYLSQPARGLLDGRPWADGISYYETGKLEKLLHIACWIVIAYLSGMRDSEIKHLKRGCLILQRTPDGTVYRHRLHSLAFKGENAHGVPAAWIVTAPVARAIAVLERLQPDNQPYLFTFLPSSHHHRQSPTPGAVFDSNTTNTGITALIGWINAYCARHSRPDGIPTTQGRLPHLTTRQFRRTLAWFIARHPGGTIAGALQYRHQRIQMFEGYAGTSTSGFRDEVEAEEALTRGQVLADMAADPDRPRLTGPAGVEAEARLTALAQYAVFDGKVVTDEARLRRIIARHDPHLYPGRFLTCVYNPDRALCRPATTSPDIPAMADCQPLACRNTALTPDNHRAVTEHMAELTASLADGDRLAPYLRHRLTEQHTATEAFLTRHTPETSP
ncbi:hypothetical protein K7B10_23100 [Streptomyces flavotricini]|uniref:Integrase n=1 Tax=Streptomyces flavotricini TaxID=66888 RepID=A0ABS8E9N0_9ACTN|nr:hypothetical protein [Streptomyces flavotricini]MCC0097618.1 hypothetical protein [Streptomyces flavotricini]